MRGKGFGFVLWSF